LQKRELTSENIERKSYSPADNPIQELKESEINQKEETKSENNCPLCGGRLLTNDTEQNEICSQCGCVVDDVTTVDDHSYNNHSSITLASSKGLDLGSELSYRKGWGGLNSLNSRSKKDIIGPEIRTLLKNTANTLQFTLIQREDTALLLRKMKKINHFKRTRNGVIVGSALFVICRRYGIACDLKRIGRVLNVKLSDLWRCYCSVKKELKIYVPVYSSRPQIKQLISRYSARVELPEHFKRKAITLSDGLDKDYLIGKKPRALSAALIYIIARQNNLNISEKKISEAARTSDTTIRKNCRSITNHLTIGDITSRYDMGKTLT